MKKTLFAISDVHGFATETIEALNKAGFRPNDPEHLLVCCGDYFDRGTENLRILRYFERLQNKVLLRGNHEDMLLKIFREGVMRENNFLNGTAETITEFFGRRAIAPDATVDFSGNSRMLDRVCDFIGEMKDYFETEHYVFTHGYLPLVATADGMRLDPKWRQADAAAWEKARWIRWSDVFDTAGAPDGKTVVCGHYRTSIAHFIDPTRDAADRGIFRTKSLIAIDANTASCGQVNVLVLENEEI